MQDTVFYCVIQGWTHCTWKLHLPLHNADADMATTISTFVHLEKLT